MSTEINLLIAVNKKVSKKVQAKMRVKKLGAYINKKKFMYLLMLPGLIYFAVFHYYPLYFLQVAFKKYNVFAGVEGSLWVGFANFERLFHSTFFMQSFKNTIILSLMNLLFAFPIPIILALLLNEMSKQALKRSFQTFIYIPHFLSWVIIFGLWKTLLSPSTGAINEIVKMFGSEPIFFMANKDWFRWILLFTNIWKESGWGTIIYLAAITGISVELYESAVIDGASRLKQVFYITIPCILPTILVLFILQLGRALNVFEQVLVMYNDVVAEVSETIDTYVYKSGIMKGDFSFASAVGLFKNIISLSLVFIANKLVKNIQGESII